MTDPISVVITFANGTYQLTNFLIKLRAANDEVRQAVKDIAGYRYDVEYTKKLRDVKFDFGSGDTFEDERYLRAQRVIKDCESYLERCEKSIEVRRSCKGPQPHLRIAESFKWVVGGKESYGESRPTLATHGVRLIALMQSLELRPDLPPPPPQDVPRLTASPYLGGSDDEAVFLTPDQQRRKRGRSIEPPSEDEDSHSEQVSTKAMSNLVAPSLLKRRKTKRNL